MEEKRSQRSYSIMTKNKSFIILLTVLITAIVISAVLMNGNGDRAEIRQKKAIGFTLTDQYGNEATRNTGEMTANELSEMIQRVSER